MNDTCYNDRNTCEEDHCRCEVKNPYPVPLPVQPRTIFGEDWAARLIESAVQQTRIDKKNHDKSKDN